MKRLFALLLCLVLCLSLIPAAAAEDVEIIEIVEEPEEDLILVDVPNADVAINATNFPDANFRSYVAENYDKNGDGFLSASEIAAVTRIIINDESISTLKGVEHFTALKTLYCNYNSLTTLDASANTALENVYCSYNNLTTLDVSGCTSLKLLHCYGNKLAALNVSYCTELTELNCSGNQLTALDVSKNTALTSLACVDNQLSALNLRKNTALGGLFCNGNNIAELDISVCPILLDVYTNGTATYYEDYISYEYHSCYLSVDASTIINTESLTAPSITTQPKSVTAAVGATVKFTVVAEGAESYQWQFRKSSSGSWANSSATGAKTATLSVEATEARNGYQYRCKVTNAAGSATSSAATLTVAAKPTITTQPKSQTVAAGTTVKFTVAASGSGLKYQWQFRKSSSGTWSNSTATGAKTKTLTVEATEARSGYQYRCKVTNTAGTATSSAAKLTVVTKPTITTQPKSVSTTAGTTVKFTVKASGGGLTYQWQFRKSSSGSWSNSTATGCKTATLTVEATAARSGYQYRCIITNAAGKVTSKAATLTVK